MAGIIDLQNNTANRILKYCGQNSEYTYALKMSKDLQVTYVTIINNLRLLESQGLIRQVREGRKKTILLTGKGASLCGCLVKVDELMRL